MIGDTQPDPAWRQRLAEALREALSLSSPARRELLARWRREDPALADALQSQLDAIGDLADEVDDTLGPATQAPFPPSRPAQGDTLFGTGPGQEAADDPGPPAAATGDRIGAWRLLHRLGAGGMGEVWLAERDDGLYAAQAAIKLLRGDVAGSGLVARFERERALLARLTHPGIARLLDAGVDQGWPFLVIEHVPGRTLSRHVRAAALPVAARVRLLLAVARAVAYAHAQLVLHRDLKPANVIVTPEGEPKLLDFGVATLLDDAGQADQALTRQVGRRVTVGYAAPEQVLGGPMGTAVDVHALGVMLYELLSGALPYARPGDDRVAIEHALLHTEPVRPTRVDPQVVPDDGPGVPPDVERARGDLEAVAAKAMRKRPAERYASVEALIDDLEAWLAHRPVSVRRDDWRHRGRLWLRRNAVFAGAGALVVASLVGGLAVALWQAGRAQDAARQSDRVTRYLGELLAAGNPDRHGGRPPTVLQLLDRSRTEVEQRFGDDPGTHARLLEVLVDTYRDLNRYDIAIPLAERLIAVADGAWGPDDPRSLESRMRLARIYVSQGSPDKVLAIAEPLRARWAALHGAESFEQANLLYLLGIGQSRVGRLADAEATLAEAQRLVDRLYRPDEFEHLFFANYVHGLRVAQERLGDAEAVLRATEPRWATTGPTYARFVLVLRRNLLAVQAMRAHYDGVEARAQALMADMDALLGRGNDMTAGLRLMLASLLSDLGRDADAAEALRRNEAELAAAGVVHAAQRVPVAARRLSAQVLAGEPLPAPEFDALLDTLQGSDVVSGPARVQAAMALMRAALVAGDDARAARALGVARVDPVLRTADALHSQVDQLEGQLQRARGRLDAAVTLAQARVDHLARAPDPPPLARWTAQLDLAVVLQARGDAGAGAALAAADALRPPALPAGHSLNAMRRELSALPPEAARRAGLGRL
ncbi:MAG: serine/threonine protein kinase [Burkholderiaceae bacterium]|nr:serine/threonine protein kinase [Burkholderiaceae bacterium]